MSTTGWVALAAIAGLVIVNLASQPPTPREREGRQIGSQYPRDEKRETDGAAVRAGSNGEQSADYHRDDRQDTATDEGLVAHVNRVLKSHYLAVIALLVALATLLQAITTVGQLKHARDTERPWLMVKVVDDSMITKALREMPNVIESPALLVARYRVANHGQVPGWLTHLHSSLVVLRDPVGANEPKTRRDILRRLRRFSPFPFPPRPNPDEVYPVDEMHWLTQEEWTAVLGHSASVVLFVFVGYADASGRIIPRKRKTWFAWEWRIVPSASNTVGRTLKVGPSDVDRWTRYT